VNTNGATTTFKINFADVPGLGTGSFLVHDMWSGTNVGTFSDSYSVSLAAHDTAAIRVTGA
jgi:alpha-galactosidase